MRIIMLGAPGAGKGTQANLLMGDFNIPNISTGNIFREAIKNETALGKEVKAIVESGQLVPDDLVVSLVKERLQQADCEHGFMLDGFPRTVAQAEALGDIIQIDYVVDIDVPEEQLVKRLTGRRVHPASGRTYHIEFAPPKVPDVDDETGEALIQRADDSEETVRDRLTVYRKQTEPLRAYYQAKRTPKYLSINGVDTVENIHQAILSALKESEQV